MQKGQVERERRVQGLGRQIPHSPLDHHEQSFMFRVVGIGKRDEWSRPAHSLPEWRLLGRYAWGVVSLCFGQVGPVVSEATTAPAENIFLMFHLFGSIDWFLDY